MYRVCKDSITYLSSLIQVSKSRLLSLIDWVHVASCYFPFVWGAIILYLASQTLLSGLRHKEVFEAMLSANEPALHVNRAAAVEVGWWFVALILILALWLSKRSKPVYLLDFACFEPPESWRLSPEQLMFIMKAQGCFNEDSLAFLERLLNQSGCGPATAWPPGIVQCLEGKPQDRSVEAARKEAEIVMFDCVRRVLDKTGTRPRDIDILVINCSLFSPTPSLCSMVVNEFGLKPNISSYNLAGMGCSAGLISIELVQSLLAARPNLTALVVSTENLTQNLYRGNERAFLVQNTLFRCGGAAMILSNKWTDGFRASLKLMHVVRNQYVSEDSFGCVYETEDSSPDMLHGVRLSKDIVKVAGRAMEQNFTMLGPHVLPVSEQLKTGFWMMMRYLAKRLAASGLTIPKVNPYIPDFKRGIDHFCIHAGGRGVIDGIEKNLNLTPAHVAPSRYALYTYGNTSSSSIWYEMDYIRTRSSLRRGQRVLQVAFGSGFKCNSCVWLCINNYYDGGMLNDRQKKMN